MTNNKWTIGGIVVALIIATLAFLQGGETIIREVKPLAGTTNYDAIDVSDGYLVDGTAVIDGSGFYASKITANAGTLRSYTIATSSTATAQTLVQADILNYDTVLFTPNVAATTLTLPASSTLTSFIPTAGDMQEQCWYNATGTAAATITFAAGTGIDWETVATSTGSQQTPPTLSANEYACFKFIRETDTDIGALYTPYVNAD